MIVCSLPVNHNPLSIDLSGFEWSTKYVISI